LLSKNNYRFRSAKVKVTQLHDSAKMCSAKMISEVVYHFQSNNEFAER